MSPFGGKKTASVLSGRAVPAAALCLLFCAAFIYLRLTDSFSFPAPAEEAQSVSSLSDDAAVGSEEEEQAAPRPEQLRRAL
ncbi:MAG: hypothetical protein J5827_05390, partial [Oscillospiraceae bacterium]|nr:hypothetical protein [Oscillospiraceae bacterium]